MQVIGAPLLRRQRARMLIQFRRALARRVRGMGWEWDCCPCAPYPIAADLPSSAGCLVALQSSIGCRIGRGEGRTYTAGRSPPLISRLVRMVRRGLETATPSHEFDVNDEACNSRKRSRDSPDSQIP